MHLMIIHWQYTALRESAEIRHAALFLATQAPICAQRVKSYALLVPSYFLTCNIYRLGFQVKRSLKRSNHEFPSNIYSENDVVP